MSEDLVKYLQSCRLCLVNEQDVDLCTEFKSKIKMFQIASSLIHEEVIMGDKLPSWVCQECASKLILFFKFKEKCIASHNILMRLYECCKSEESDSVKTESISVQNVPENDEICKDGVVLIPVLSPPVPEPTEEVSTEVERESFKEEYNNTPADLSKSNSPAHSDEMLVEYEEFLEYPDEDHDVLATDDDAELKNVETLDYEIADLTDSSTTNEDVMYLEQTIDDEVKLHPVKITSSSLNCTIHSKELLNELPTIQYHTTGEKRFECNICGSKFGRKSYLEIHTRIHLNERPYVCNICQKGFIKSGDLIRHGHVHSDVKKHMCAVCARNFKRLTDLTTHLRSHTGEKPYKCNLCEKSYASHSSRKKHLKTHERKTAIKKVDKEVVC